jgi:hypothetical protein
MGRWWGWGGEGGGDWQSAGNHTDLHSRYLHFRTLRDYGMHYCRYRRLAALASSRAVWPHRARTDSQVAKDIEAGTNIELAASAKSETRATSGSQDRATSAATTVVDFHDEFEEEQILPGADFTTNEKDLARQVLSLRDCLWLITFCWLVELNISNN